MNLHFHTCTWEILRTTTRCVDVSEKHIQVHKIFKDLKKRENVRVCAFLEICVDFKYGYIDVEDIWQGKNNFFG